jgi:hypothetical protein
MLKGQIIMSDPNRYRALSARTLGIGGAAALALFAGTARAQTRVDNGAYFSLPDGNINLVTRTCEFVQNNPHNSIDKVYVNPAKWLFDAAAQVALNADNGRSDYDADIALLLPLVADNDPEAAMLLGDILQRGNAAYNFPFRMSQPTVTYKYKPEKNFPDGYMATNVYFRKPDGSLVGVPQGKALLYQCTYLVKPVIH